MQTQVHHLSPQDPRRPEVYKNITLWHPHVWPRVMLDSTILFRVTGGTGEDIGYVWFTIITTQPKVIYEMHLCTDPQYHGKWLTPKVLVDLIGYAYVDMQADRILATHADPSLRSVLQRIGFESSGAFTNILNMEKPNGILRRFIRRWGR